MKKLLLSIAIIMALTSCEKYELEDFENEKSKPTQINQPSQPIGPGDDGWVNPPVFDLGPG